MSRKNIITAVLSLILIVTAVSLAGALGKVSVLEDQLRLSQDSTKVAVDSLRVEQDESDALIEAQEENEERTAEIIEEAEAAVEEATTGSDAALAALRVAARGLPVVQEALARVTQELSEEREAHEIFQATSAAEIFAGQQRERTLGRQLISERDASADVVAGLNRSLALAIERGDILERVIAPGFFRKIFDMPEVALAGAVFGGGLVYMALR